MPARIAGSAACKVQKDVSGADVILLATWLRWHQSQIGPRGLAAWRRAGDTSRAPAADQQQDQAREREQIMAIRLARVSVLGGGAVAGPCVVVDLVRVGLAEAVA